MYVLLMQLDHSYSKRAPDQQDDQEREEITVMPQEKPLLGIRMHTDHS